MNEEFVSGRLPILALRGIVIFPDQTVHFDVGRVKSALALEDAMKHDQVILLVPQKDILEDDPGLNGLYPVVLKIGHTVNTSSNTIAGDRYSHAFH